MNRDEILALSGEVFIGLAKIDPSWVEWWSPGQFCVGCPEFPAEKHRELQEKFGLGHEVPPPDLTEPANFLRALKALPTIALVPEIHWLRSRKCFVATVEALKTSTVLGVGCADTPELALLLALVDYVRRGKEKP